LAIFAAIRRAWSFVSNLAADRETLRTLKHEQHGLITCARLTKSGERLKLRRVVEGIERIHVRELDDENAIRLPMPPSGILWVEVFVR